MGSSCFSKQSVDSEASTRSQVPTRGHPVESPVVGDDGMRAASELAAAYACPSDVPSHKEVDEIIQLMSESLCKYKPSDPVDHVLGLLQHVQHSTLNEASRYSSGVSKVNNTTLLFYPSDYDFKGSVADFLKQLGEKYPYESTSSTLTDASNLWESVRALEELSKYPNGSSAYSVFKDSIKREPMLSVQQIYKHLRGVQLEKSDVLARVDELLQYATDTYRGTMVEELSRGVDENGESLLDILHRGWNSFNGNHEYKSTVSKENLEYNELKSSLLKQFTEAVGLDYNNSSLQFIPHEVLQALPPTDWKVRRVYQTGVPTETAPKGSDLGCDEFYLKNCRTSKNPTHDVYRRIIHRLKQKEKEETAMDLTLNSVDEWMSLLRTFIRWDKSVHLIYLNTLDEWERLGYTPSLSDAKDLVLKSYARLIGVDLFKSPLDVWIVIEGLKCPLPVEWKKVNDGDDVYFEHLEFPDYRIVGHPCVEDYKWIARHVHLFTKTNQFQEQVDEKVDRIRALSSDPAKNNIIEVELNQLYQLVYLVSLMRRVQWKATQVKNNSQVQEFCHRCFAEIESMQDRYWLSSRSANTIDRILSTAMFVMRAASVNDFRLASPNFSKEDFMAVYLYTAEIPELSEQVWYAMNKAMRENDERQIRLFRPLIAKLDTSLRNLQGNDCIVFRGIKVRIDKESLYRVGNTIYWNAFSSSSKSTDVAKSFSFNEQTGAVGTLFIVGSSSSRSVALFSAFPEEEEFLFPSNTPFEIVGVIPESHLQLLSCNSDIVSMREVRPNMQNNSQTAHESIQEKLQFSQKIQFVYEDFLRQFICPNARFTPDQVSTFPVVPYMQGLSTRRGAGGRRGLCACVIGSPPGGGKSTLGIWVVPDVQQNNYMWNSKQKRTAIPFFISLPSLGVSVFEESGIVRNLQTLYQLSELEMQTLKEDFEVVLILDSLDEVPPQLFDGASTHDLLKLNRFEEWNHLTVFITCREALLARRPAKSMFDMKEDWGTVYLAPFAVENIHSYIKVHNRADFTQYAEILQHNASVQELLTSPFLCWLIVPFLTSLDARYSKKFGKLGRAECYEHALQERMKRNTQRLQKLMKEMSIEVSEEELLNDCTIFGQGISCHMFSLGETMTEVRSLRNARIEKENWSVGLSTALRLNQKEVFQELVRSQISRSDSVNGSSTFSFRHLSIMEYFVARALWQNTFGLLPTLKHNIISVQSIVVIEMFKSIYEWQRMGCGAFSLRSWQEVEVELHQCLCTGESGERALSSAAFTLLGQCGVVTGSYKNLQAPGALLSGAYLKGCDLTGANLRGADLQDVCFEECTLDHSDLESCIVDVYPPIKHASDQNVPVEVTASGSPNGEQFATLTKSGPWGDSGWLAVWSRERSQLSRTIVKPSIEARQPWDVMEYSHNGQFLIIACRKTVLLCNTSGTILRELVNEWDAEIRTLAISLDDSIVIGRVWAAKVHKFIFWTVSDGTILSAIDVELPSCQITPMNSGFVISHGDGTLHLYTSSGEKEGVLDPKREQRSANNLVSVIDNTWMVSATGHEGHLWCRGTYSRTLPLFESLNDDSEYGVSLMVAKGTAIAILSWSEKTRIAYRHTSVFNLEGELKFRLQGSITAMCFCKGCALLIAGFTTGSVGIWDVSSGANLRTLSWHTKEVSRVFTMPAKGRLAEVMVTSSKDGTVRMLNIRDSYRSDTAETNVSCVGSLGQYIITGNVGGQLKIWSNRGFHVKTLKRHTQKIVCIAAAPNGQKFVTAGESLVLWSGHGENPITLRRADTQADVLSCVFMADSSHFATVTGSGEADVWSFEGKLIQNFAHASMKHIVGVEFSVDGKYLYAGTRLSTISVHIRESGAGKWVETKSIQTGVEPVGLKVMHICVLPDGSGIAASTGGRPLYAVLSSADGVMQHQLKGGSCTALRCSNDSKCLATVHEFDTADWDNYWTTPPDGITPIKGGLGLHGYKVGFLRVHELADEKGTEYWYGDKIMDFQFTHDSSEVLIACGSTIVVVSWKEKKMKFLSGHSDTITYITRPTAESFATISNDGTLRFWRKHSDEWQCCSLMPGPTTLSFVGTSFEGVRSSEDLRQILSEQNAAPLIHAREVYGYCTAVKGKDQ